MDEESILCIACGNPVLPRTASKNSGRCLPCARGYRDNLERSRLALERQKELAKLPESVYWRDLVARVNDPELGFNSLAEAEKVYFALCLLEGEVYNGGFDQFFFNSSSDFYEYAVTGLRLVGAETSLALLLEAKGTLFGDQDVPPDTEIRRKSFPGLYNNPRPPLVDATLDKLDDKFYRDEDELGDRIHRFGVEHTLWEIDTNT